MASNVWLGVSVENQHWTSRIDELRKIPVAVRFLSCEPLLGPLKLDLDGIHWVIVGGESGRRARPMRGDWASGVRDQCARAGVAFFSSNGARTTSQASASARRRRGVYSTAQRLTRCPRRSPRRIE